MGIYATVIFVLGLTSQLASLLNPDKDEIGRSLEEEHLPQRVRLRKNRNLDRSL